MVSGHQASGRQSQGAGRVSGLMTSGMCQAWPLVHSRWRVRGRVLGDNYICATRCSHVVDAEQTSHPEHRLTFLAFFLAACGADHSITWSARCRIDRGIVRPSAFAVLMLITNSNFVGCSTGRSAGLAPFKILST